MIMTSYERRYESLLKDIKKDARELVSATPLVKTLLLPAAAGVPQTPTPTPTPAPRAGNDVYISASFPEAKASSSLQVVDPDVIKQVLFQEKMFDNAKGMFEKDRATRGRYGFSKAASDLVQLGFSDANPKMFAAAKAAQQAFEAKPMSDACWEAAFQAFSAILDSGELAAHAQQVAEHAASYANISYETMDLLDAAVESMHSVNKSTDAQVFETENREKAFKIFAEVFGSPDQHVHTRVLVEPSTPTIKFSHGAGFGGMLQRLTSGAALRKSDRELFLFNDVVVIFNASKKDRGVTKMKLTDLIVVTADMAYSPETGQIDCWHLEPLQRAMADLKINFDELSEEEKRHQGLMMIGSWQEGYGTSTYDHSRGPLMGTPPTQNGGLGCGGGQQQCLPSRTPISVPPLGIALYVMEFMLTTNCAQ